MATGGNTSFDDTSYFDAIEKILDDLDNEISFNKISEGDGDPDPATQFKLFDSDIHKNLLMILKLKMN